MTNLYKKDDKLVIAIDKKSEFESAEPRLSIDDFLCCGPTAWRIKKSNDYSYTNTPSGGGTHHCDSTNFQQLYGTAQRSLERVQRKVLSNIPRKITFESVDHEFEDGINNEYWCHMPDHPDKKIYLEMDFLEGPCFPENRSETQGGVTKTCTRISPDYLIGNDGKLKLNTSATYSYTVKKTLNSGGVIPGLDDSECAGDENLSCTLIKAKTVKYNITRTRSENGTLSCCAINGVIEQEESKSGYVVCPQDASSEDAIVGDAAHDDAENIYRQTEWTEKLILEVLILDRDGNNDIWVPVLTSGGELEFCETTYAKKCWSKGPPSNPRNNTINIGASPGDTPYCDDNEIEEDYLSDPPPCLTSD
jgi:hypothetical protein